MELTVCFVLLMTLTPMLAYPYIINSLPGEYWSDDDDWDYSNPMLGYESDSDDYGYMDDIPDVMERRFKFAFKDAGEKRFKNAIKFKDADEKRFKNAFKFKDAGEKRFKNAFKFKGA